MESSDQVFHELVINVIEARHLKSSIGNNIPGSFGRGTLLNDRSCVYVECAIDGVVRRTSPGAMLRDVSGVFKPVWNTNDGNLIYQIDDSNALQSLKAHSPRFTLKIYNKADNAKVETLGFVTLDLRDPSLYDPLTDKKAEWHKINGANSSNGAELKLIASMKLCTKSSIQQSLHQTNQNTLIAAAEDNDYIIIGSNCDADYFLSITLLSCYKLEYLFDPQEFKKIDLEAKALGKKYWLSYTMFDVVIETDTFQSLSRPTFAPIRDSFKLRSNVEDISLFLSSAPVTIQLHSKGASFNQNELVASAVVTFKSLFDTATSISPFDEAVTTCAFPFLRFTDALRNNEEMIDSVTHHDQSSAVPAVAVTLELKKQIFETKQMRNTATEVSHTPPFQYTQSSSEVDHHWLVKVTKIELDAVENDSNARNDGVVLLLKPSGTVYGNELISAVYKCGNYGDLVVDSVQHMQTKYASCGSIEDACLILDVVSANDNDVVVGRGMVNLHHQQHIDGTLRTIEQCIRITDIHSQEELCIGAVTLSIDYVDEHMTAVAAQKATEENNNAEQREQALIRAMVQEEEQLNQSQLNQSHLNQSLQEEDLLDDTMPHKFQISIDLRSIKGLHDTKNVYVQYTYPLFGLQVNKTRPPILVQKHSERVLPHGISSYEFTASYKRLQEVANSEPLVFELWHKDQYKANERLGIATLPLNHLLRAKHHYKWNHNSFATLGLLNSHRSTILKSLKVHSNSASSNKNYRLATERRMTAKNSQAIDGPVTKVHHHDSYMTVCLFESQVTEKMDKQLVSTPVVKKVASIRIVATFTDYGPVGSKLPVSSFPYPTKVVRQPQPSVKQATAAETKQRQSQHDEEEGEENYDDEQFESGHENDEESFAKENDTTVDEESKNNKDAAQSSEWLENETLKLRQAWLEFEAWKANEMELFESSMKATETQRMVELEQEWATREHARAMVTRKAQEEYKEIEARLKRALVDVEKRERAVNRLESDLKRAGEEKMTDLQISLRRMKEESDHQVLLQKERCAALEKRIKRKDDLYSQLEARLKAVENEYSNYREAQRKSPEAKLLADIAALQGEKAEVAARLEREKLDRQAEIKAKETIKAQLLRVAKELRKYKQMENNKAARDLEKLRIEYLAREERYILDGDRAELNRIKNQLDQLRMVSATNETATLPARSNDENINQLNELHRLIKERDDLLHSASYDENSSIIKQLNCQIESLQQFNTN